MSDALLQAYIPSVATMIVIAMGFFFNNSRLTDIRDGLNRRMDDSNARMDRIENRIDRIETRMDQLQTQYSRLESVIIGKLDEIEARLHRLEDRG